LQQAYRHEGADHPPPFQMFRTLQALAFDPDATLPGFVEFFDAPTQFVIPDDLAYLLFVFHRFAGQQDPA
jgi:hypothetical protein